jgi:hypothetical protein
MKRCLLTIQPVLQRLRLKRGCCICHGAGYEFKGAGTEFGGTSSVEIAREFPDWEFVGFHSSGRWDYRGGSPKETDSEVRLRAQLFVRWLRDLVREILWSKIPGDGSSAHHTGESTSPPSRATMVLVGHQSFGDLLCQLLVSGTDANWEYGMPIYRMKNAAITELFLTACGTARLGILSNDDDHLVSLRGIQTAR